MKKILFLLGLLICPFINSVVAANDDSPQESLNSIMTHIGKIMVDITPIIYAQKSFTKTEKEHLHEALAQLSGLFRAAQPFIEKKPEGYQISYEFISHYLDVVETVLENGRIDYARNHLYALGEICASCHTQDTTLRTLFSDFNRDRFDSDYAFAELNYITREYGQAVEYYEAFLNSSGPKTELEIIEPLQRIITIYTQVKNNPGEGLKILKKYLDYKQHTPETLTEMRDWMRGLEALQEDVASESAEMTFPALKGDVEKYLGDMDEIAKPKHASAQEEVALVWLRGQLYHYLNRQASREEIPALLYWLAVVDRSIEYRFYFSLSDLYLKQCVLHYPKSEYAPRCFAEYKNYMEYTYRRQGESIPPGISQELVQMQNALTPIHP